MLSLQSVSIHSGKFHLSSISFDIAQGECVALMGPSGSGKTTILEAICGLRPVGAGTIRLAGDDMTYLKPQQRSIALVPQDNALFPNLSVEQNLSFALQLQKLPSTQITARVEDLAEQLGIQNLLKQMPHTLSGGEAKRVALGRALANQPKLLLLDEALTGLDDQTHAETLEVIRSTINNHKGCTLQITHSSHEARLLADRVIQMSELI